MNNDKKKTMVLGVLGVALIAVGAFQFMPKGGGTTPPAATTGTESPQTSPVAEGGAAKTENVTSGNAATPGGKPGEAGDEKSDPQKQVLAMLGRNPLAKRDPFAPQGDFGKPAVVPTVNKTLATAKTSPITRSSGSGPGRMMGSIPPFDPGAPTGNLNSGPIGLSGSTPLRQSGDFAYTMKGVIVGDKPMAVFEDDGGNQRLVPLGGSVDRDTKVVGIEKGKVRIRHRGKDKTLNLPEGP